MNAAMFKALTLDALYQVLDNKVFRVLLVLVLIPILITFLIGFREEEMVFLFGVESWSYDAIVSFLLGGRPAPGDIDHQGLVVAGLVELFVNQVGGKLGVMLSIAATAFFVPQMIEKGSADVLFHKPINRFLLFLSRYFAGLIFIALVTLVAVTGMYLGLLFVSGYNDPGILWAALTLSYLFGLVHCVSMLVGVVTRSTVASILVTLIFFFGNGCLQFGWTIKEQVVAEAEVLKAAKLAERIEAGEEPSEEDEEDEGRLLKTLIFGLDVLHYVLPKTNDAGHITRKLRSVLEAGETFVDEDSEFSVQRLTGGLAKADADTASLPVGGSEGLLGEAVFASATEDGSYRFSVWARERLVRKVEFAGRPRDMLESASAVGDQLSELLVVQLALSEDAIQRDREPIGTHGVTNDFGPSMISTAANHVIWEEGERFHHVVFFGRGRRFNAIALETPSDLDEQEREEWTENILKQCGIKNTTSEGQWYTNQLGWDSKLKFNLFFSILSSLAFAIAVLALGGWRLSRVDF